MEPHVMSIFLSILSILGYLCIILFVGLYAKKQGVGVLMVLYSAMIVTSFVFVNKLGVFGTVDTTVVVILYGLTFLVTDIVSEFFGRTQARQTLLCGLGSIAVFYFTLFLVLSWPAPGYWADQQAFETVFGSSVRIFIAGMLSLSLAIFQDVALYHYLKEKTKGKLLWLRNIVSTTVSQLFDNVIFFFVAFYGIWSLESIIAAIIGVSFILRPLLSILDTPIMYVLKWHYEKTPSTS